jgi:hypothetical protein
MANENPDKKVFLIIDEINRATRYSWRLQP